jgi:hypothetical protein
VSGTPQMKRRSVTLFTAAIRIRGTLTAVPVFNA